MGWLFCLYGGAGGNLPALAMYGSCVRPERPQTVGPVDFRPYPASREFSLLGDRFTNKKTNRKGWFFCLYGGAGGNRTRVRKSSTCSSTCVVTLFGFNSPCREGTHYTYRESLSLASCNVTVLQAI